LQQEGNFLRARVEANRAEDEENSHKRDRSRRTEPLDGVSNDLLKIMRKEMDELKNAMKEKTNKNLDGMVKRTDSPFTTKVLECPLPPKFGLLQLESYDSMKDPLDHITTFKITLSLQQMPNEILCRSFPITLKRAARVWFSKLAQTFIDDFKQLSNSFMHHFVSG